MFIITTLATYIAFPAFVALGLIWIVICGLVYLFNKNAAGIMAQKYTRTVSYVTLFTTGSKLKYIGLENLDKSIPTLYVCNHRSIFDILLSYRVFPSRTAFVAKDSLGKIPYLKQLMFFLQCPLIDRSNPREGIKAILRAIENIKQGISIFIFPEGTRIKNGDKISTLPFHNGSFKIAQRTHCRIIPIAMTNSDTILQKGSPFVHPAKIVVNIGSPIDIDSLPPEERKTIGKYTENKIREMLVENQSYL